MTTSEIKSEIQKSLDKIPESALREILDYLKQFENQSDESIKLTKNLREILKEDKGLLERLAK